jgi:choice-of-anchor B domain-containing protein
MKLLSFCFLFLFLSSSMYSQILNVELLSNLNQYPSIGYNDIWGYTDSEGREYALLGTRHGTSIVEITNPQQPVERAFIPGPNSTWRDIKTHSHYAYIVTEGTGTGTGLQIVDLSQLPNTAALVNTVTTWFTSAHNIYIDNGFAYVVGTGSGGGMHIIDLSNPTNPARTAYYTGSGYIHDVYVWNDTAYASAGSSRTYDMVNLANKSNPQLINNSIPLSSIYAHSGWLTEDKDTLLLVKNSTQEI